MKRKTFVFYISWWNALSKFPMEIHLAVFNAVMTYVSTGEVPEIEDDMVRMGFELIREDIDMAQEKYDAKRQTRSRAAQKRWARAKEDNPEESQPQTSKESTTMPEEEVSEEEMPEEDMPEEGMFAEEESEEESSDDEEYSPSSEIVATYGRQPFEPLTLPYADAGSASRTSNAVKTSRTGSASRTSEREIYGNRGNPERNSDAIEIDYGDYGTRFAV